MEFSPSSTVTLNTGREMPLMGFGTWRLISGTPAIEAVEHSLKQGFRMVDTSSDYGTHDEVGQAINRSKIPRNEIFLITKVEEDDDAYEATLEYLEQLDQEYVDLMLIHRPPKFEAGEELWQGLIRARREGLVRDIGVSNYNIEQIEDLVADSGVTPAVNQIEWSPFGHSEEMLDHCSQNGIIIQAYSSLTHGKRVDDPKIEELAAKYKKTPAQIMIRWNMQLGVVPIIKAQQKPHIEENFDVFGFKIATEDMLEINSLNEQYSALGELAYV